MPTAMRTPSDSVAEKTPKAIPPRGTPTTIRMPRAITTSSAAHPSTRQNVLVPDFQAVLNRRCPPRSIAATLSTRAP